jgi:hypothetical protein
MRLTGISATAGALLALLWACDGSHSAPTGSDTIVGSDVIATEERPVAGFNAVSIDHPGRLIVERTGSESLQVTAEDNILPLVRSDVAGGRLTLSLAPGRGLTLNREIVYRLTVAELDDVEASGTARIELRGMRAEGLGVRLSGASMLRAAGECGALTILLSGASQGDTGALSARSVTAALSGASYGLVRASESLIVTATGASRLEYLGDPRVTSTVSGGSSVRRVGP